VTSSLGDRSMSDAVGRRDVEFREAYGFGIPVEIPRYREARRGTWRIYHRKGGLGPGYVSETVIDPDYHVLSEGPNLWMSTTFLERESHAWHLACCTGTVAIAGLGMGMMAHAAAARPEVTSVVVIEIAPHVIGLFQDAAGIADAAIREKITVHQGDAANADLIARVRRSHPTIDYAFADIWETYPDPAAAAWTAAWISGLGARAGGFWGQEAEIARHCHDRRIPPDRGAIGRCLTLLGLPSRPTPGYVTFVADVALAHGLLDHEDGSSPAPTNPTHKRD
jgi:hypothetical protein